jgi:dolichol-phosphate mannosyltransferase
MAIGTIPSVESIVSPAPGRDVRVSPLELTVVVPSFNERPNVPLMLEKLQRALGSIEWEVIYVDDNSPDGTSSAVREFARYDRRVRVIERIGRRGLSSACIEGMMASAAPYIAVIDADLQHDESVLPQMLRRIESEGVDVVVASRKIEGGSMGEFASKRVKLSNLGTSISKLVLHCEVSDPMSGFFMVEARFLRAVVPHLTGSGFKILLDLLASSPTPPRVAEVPYTFSNRQFGESKLDLNVELEYLFLVVDKMVGRVLPTRFALFLLVGAFGVVLNLSILGVLYLNHIRGFAQSQAIATVITMTFNFLLNNVVTFRDRRLRGKRLAIGLIKFYAACSLGAVINLAFAMMLVREGVEWYIAGAVGTAISSVWNYSVNTVLTWRQRRR